MKSIIGEIIEIFIQGGSTKGLVRIKGGLIEVPLLLVMNAKKGDRVIIESGIAISTASAEDVSKN